MSDIWMGWIKRESGSQGYGAMGDKGRAYGLYQFDYRYALVPYLRTLVAKSSTFKDFLPFASYSPGSEKLVNNSILHDLFRKFADNTEFQKSQDDFAYKQYYEPAAKHMVDKWSMNPENHSAAFRGSLFSMSIRSGQENGASRMHQSGSEEEILRKAYATYGDEDAGRWPKQLADALAYLKTETPKNYISRGDMGPEVSRLQSLLNLIGYTCIIDGSFGSQTESRLKEFQYNNGLVVDGLYGEASKATLERIYNDMAKTSKVTFTQDQWLEGVKKKYVQAHKGNYSYGDSTVLPPCSDHKISCERLAYSTLYDLGMTDQRKGGEVISTSIAWNEAHGFMKITNKRDLQGGDIVYVDDERHNNTPDWKWHVFVIVSYDPSTGMCYKYDMGSPDRIKAAQPFYTKLEEWGNSKKFRFAYRPPYVRKKGVLDGTYIVESAVDRNFVVDVKGASLLDKANVWLYKKNGTKAQVFVFEHISDGYYRIKNIKSGRMIDVSGGKVKNRQNIQQYVWNWTKSQLWKPTKNKDGSYTFVSALNKQYVLDLAGGKAASKQDIWLYKSNGTNAQNWFLTKV